MQAQQSSPDKKIEPETFSFCVGCPWEQGGTSISVYAYGDTVKHGTMDEAREFRKYVNERTGEENFIYKLVQVPE